MAGDSAWGGGGGVMYKYKVNGLLFHMFQRRASRDFMLFFARNNISNSTCRVRGFGRFGRFVCRLKR
jgi:hypothetical protein